MFKYGLAITTKPLPGTTKSKRGLDDERFQKTNARVQSRVDRSRNALDNGDYQTATDHLISARQSLENYETTNPPDPSRTNGLRRKVRVTERWINKKK